MSFRFTIRCRDRGDGVQREDADELDETADKAGDPGVDMLRTGQRVGGASCADHAAFDRSKKLFEGLKYSSNACT